MPLKRESIIPHDNANAGESISTVVPLWMQLNRDRRTLLHGIGNAIHAVKRDIAEEGYEVLSRFHLTLLPQYEPSYIWKSIIPIPSVGVSDYSIDDPEYTYRSNLDYLFSNTFNSTEPSGDPVILDSNSEIISGLASDGLQLLAVDSAGDVIVFDMLTGDELSRTPDPHGIAKVQTFETYDESSILLKGAYEIISVTDHNNIPIEYTAIIKQSKNYDSAYDLNGNGIIDPEDIDQFRSANGISHNSVSVEMWNDRYTNLDINRDGIIDDRELMVAEKLLWECSADGVIIHTDRTLPMIRVTAKQYSDAAIGHVYLKNETTVKLKNNYRGFPWFHERSNPSTIKCKSEPTFGEYAIELTDDGDVEFVKTRKLIIAKSKVNFDGIGDWLPIYITVENDILFILTKSLNDSIADHRVYFADLRVQALEYITTYFTLKNMDIIPKWMSVVCRQSNKMYIGGITDNGAQAVKTYNLISKYYTIVNDELYINGATGVTLDVSSLDVIPPQLVHLPGAVDDSGFVDSGFGDSGFDERGFNSIDVSSLSMIVPLVPIAAHNSVDDYCYNWGLRRLPGEKNIEFINRTGELYRYPQGDNHAGLINGIGRAIGIPIDEIRDLSPTVSTKITLQSQWMTIQPIVFIVVNDRTRTATARSFKTFKIHTDGLRYGQTELLGACIPTGELFEYPPELTGYVIDFPLHGATPELTVKNINDDGYAGNWDFTGADIESNDVLYVVGGVIDMIDAPNMLSLCSDNRVYIFYDAMDKAGNHHRGNFDVIDFQHIKTTDHINDKIVVENLLDIGSKYRDDILGSEELKLKFIKENSKLDTSKWKTTTLDRSFYNTVSMCGEYLRETKWGTFSPAMYTDSGWL